ncbi:MAG: hypothetical protein QME05_02495, partial [Candidatus Margulisbacteria bacterium]|nr:hypothetical protein [Candidatus Margulisiibacteriota bacterium]
LSQLVRRSSKNEGGWERGGIFSVSGVRVIAILFFCFFGIYLFGCARTVTPIVDYGEQMTVTVTLRGTMEVVSHHYYLVFSSSSGLTIPLPSPDNPYYYEMIEPGTTPINGAIADYYTNYYSTWSSYIIADTTGYAAVMGPFVLGQAITRDAFANLGDLTTTIRFVVPLNKIFTTTPDYVYFDFVSVNWPDGSPKISADHLTTTNAYISKISGSIVEIADSEDPTIAAAADILNCKVEMQ